MYWYDEDLDDQSREETEVELELEWYEEGRSSSTAVEVLMLPERR
jgi:hypothetical protein